VGTPSFWPGPILHSAPLRVFTRNTHLAEVRGGDAGELAARRFPARLAESADHYFSEPVSTVRTTDAGRRVVIAVPSSVLEAISPPTSVPVHARGVC